MDVACDQQTPFQLTESDVWFHRNSDAKRTKWPSGADHRLRIGSRSPETFQLGNQRPDLGLE